MKLLKIKSDPFGLDRSNPGISQVCLGVAEERQEFGVRNTMGSVNLLVFLLGGKWEIYQGNGWYWENAKIINEATDGLIEGDYKALELARKGRFPLLCPGQAGDVSESFQVLWLKGYEANTTIDELIVVVRSANLPGLLAPDVYSVTTTEVWRNIRVEISTGGASIRADKFSVSKENR